MRPPKDTAPTLGNSRGKQKPLSVARFLNAVPAHRRTLPTRRNERGKAAAGFSCFEQKFKLYSKIEQKVLRFPFWPVPTVPGCPILNLPAPEWHICYLSRHSIITQIAEFTVGSLLVLHTVWVWTERNGHMSLL